MSRLGSALGIVAGLWFWAAVIAMYFTSSYPFLGPFAKWTFRIYFGVLAGGVAGFMVIAPGVLMGRELFESLSTPHQVKWERRLTLLWCAGAGMLLSLLLAAALAFIATGILKDIKLWFIGVCWAVLLVPWVLAGLAGRWLFRRYLRRRGQRAPGPGKSTV